MITLSIVCPFLCLYLTCSWMDTRLPEVGADTEEKRYKYSDDRWVFMRHRERTWWPFDQLNMVSQPGLVLNGQIQFSWSAVLVEWIKQHCRTGLTHSIKNTGCSIQRNVQWSEVRLNCCRICLLVKVHPILKIESLSTHLHASGKLGRVF